MHRRISAKKKRAPTNLLVIALQSSESLDASANDAVMCRRLIRLRSTATHGLAVHDGDHVRERNGPAWGFLNLAGTIQGNAFWAGAERLVRVC